LQVFQQDSYKKSMKESQFYKYYYNNIIKYDCVNRFQYKKVQEIPKINQICCKATVLEDSAGVKKARLSLASALTYLTRKRGMNSIKGRKIEDRKHHLFLLYGNKKIQFLAFLKKEALNTKKHKLDIDLNWTRILPKNRLICGTFLRLGRYNFIRKNHRIYHGGCGKTNRRAKYIRMDITCNTKSVQELRFLLNSYKLFRFKKSGTGKMPVPGHRMLGKYLIFTK
jgi:hypothetical protein